ncbi:unnamed protein product [Brachionus calyciflorus]|uniref:HipA-like C-terminal domain-containing protein n=1 Tax=Brachionus calyciflorus TaxID=104777 RepID=A0A814BJ58_9BILA|nr:unnamed protein product [Brachionus calyciflorus]
MGHFMRNSRLCKHEDLLKLFKRILACILIGNTDAHLKNFAMFHNHDGSLSLTPMYDIVASSFYPQLNTLALTMNGKKDAIINNLKPKQIVEFALNPKGFGLNAELLIEIIDEFNIYKQQAYYFLKSENTNENVQKRIITMGHRPMYCTNADNDDCTKFDDRVRNGMPYVKTFGLEELFYKFCVDGKFFKEKPYTNPKAPNHIVTESAGCKENHDSFGPQKDFCAFRANDYGYTRMQAFNNTHLYFELVSDDKDGQVIDKFWIIKESHSYN